MAKWCLSIAFLIATATADDEFDPDSFEALNPKFGSKEEGMISEMFDGAVADTNLFDKKIWSDAEKAEDEVAKKAASFSLDADAGPAEYARNAVNIAFEKGQSEGWNALLGLANDYKSAVAEIAKLKQNGTMLLAQKTETEATIDAPWKMEAAVSEAVKKSKEAEAKEIGLADASKVAALQSLTAFKTKAAAVPVDSKESLSHRQEISDMEKQIQVRYQSDLKAAVSKKLDVFEEEKALLGLPIAMDFESLVSLMNDEKLASSGRNELESEQRIQQKVDEYTAKIQKQDAILLKNKEDQLANHQASLKESIVLVQKDADAMVSKAVAQMEVKYGLASKKTNLHELMLLSSGDEAKKPTPSASSDKLAEATKTILQGEKMRLEAQKEKLKIKLQADVARNKKEIQTLADTKTQWKTLASRLAADLKGVRMWTSVVNDKKNEIEPVDANCMSFAKDYVEFSADNPVEVDVSAYDGKTVGDVVQQMKQKASAMSGEVKGEPMTMH